MTALVAIVPSRGRPHSAREVAAAFRDTCRDDTLLVLAVDHDDPTLERYLDLMAPGRVDVYIASAPSTMVKTLNAAAVQYAPRAAAVAFMGDDHRPRTAGWDHAYVAALDAMGTGIVYGDDLLQGPAIPTQVAMSSNIVRALGHMAPPPLTHLFVDNYWRDLGNAAGCLRYMPEVIVEHMHPFAAKAVMDDGYARVNAASMYAADGAAYTSYNNAGHLSRDIVAVGALRVS